MNLAVNMIGSYAEQPAVGPLYSVFVSVNEVETREHAKEIRENGERCRVVSRVLKVAGQRITLWVAIPAAPAPGAWSAMGEAEAKAICDGATLVQALDEPDERRWFTCKGAGSGDDQWCDKCRTPKAGS